MSITQRSIRLQGRQGCRRVAQDERKHHDRPYLRALNRADRALDDSCNHQQTERIRRHGNFVGNVPMVLLPLLTAEAPGSSGTWLRGVGGILAAARLDQIFGNSFDKVDLLPLAKNHCWA